MSNFQLGVIGAGNMSTAILKGLVKSGVLAAEAIVAYDPGSQCREQLEGELGITFVDTVETAAACPRIMMGVKPFILEEVLQGLASNVREDATLISIAAGVTSARIDAALGGRGRIVRVMPNTPMLVGHGVSAVSAGPRATEEDMRWVQQMFTASGIAKCMDESLLDAVTGVSGSGPAYFFLFVEAMASAGEKEGLDPETAVEFATHTCLGAGKLLAGSSLSPAELRRQVTTPKGTTEAAIVHMQENGMPEIVADAIGKAAARSRELGK